MGRLTRRILECKLAQVNEAFGIELYLDYAACYGGYCCRMKPCKYNNLACRMSTKWRMTGQELNAYLDGILEVSRYIKEKGYDPKTT